MAKQRRAKKPKEVATLVHDEQKRRNIPTAKYKSMLEKEARDPLRVAYERRNRDLDPQLVWRGKDEQDWSDLVVNAPPLFEKPKSGRIAVKVINHLGDEVMKVFRL